MIENHINNGVIEASFDSDDKVICFKKIKGTYIRFQKRKNKIKIGVLEPVIKPKNLDIFNEIVDRYKIKNILKKGNVLYGVIKKGVNKPIIFFYNMSFRDKNLCWKDFFEICMQNKIALMSIYSVSLFKDLNFLNNKEDYIIRYYNESKVIGSKNLHKRLHWH